VANYRLSPQAEQDIEAILEWTHAECGEKIRRRYETLLTRAIMDVAEDAKRAGSRARPEIGVAARSYHLRHSGDRVRKSIGKIDRPRHILVFRIRDDHQVDIARVLHDGMDLDRHVPEDVWPVG
jgi:toxin ParE1/3/4